MVEYGLLVKCCKWPRYCKVWHGMVTIGDRCHSWVCCITVYPARSDNGNKQTVKYFKLCMVLYIVHGKMWYGDHCWPLSLLGRPTPWAAPMWPPPSGLASTCRFSAIIQLRVWGSLNKWLNEYNHVFINEFTKINRVLYILYCIAFTSKIMI